MAVKSFRPLRERILELYRRRGRITKLRKGLVVTRTRNEMRHTFTFILNAYLTKYSYYRYSRDEENDSDIDRSRLLLKTFVT